MGYVCSCNSENNLFHWHKCRYVKMIAKKNRIEITTTKEARDQGYKYCKCCSTMMRKLQDERLEAEQFGKRHGIQMIFDRDDGAIDVVSKSGRWKLVYNSKKDHVFLYHKNNSKVPHKDDFISGYHYQSAYSDSLLGYLEYIYEHDSYRMNNPLYAQKFEISCDKGGKKRKNRQRKKQRKQSIRYVNYLLNGMASGALVL